ncbi:MAG: hypothetical protein AAFX78_01185 [Cyanobacteria bacterium J06638_20]
MQFFRQYIAPLFVVLLFALALVVVSARIFLPNDMMAPAPIGDEIGQVQPADTDGALANASPTLNQLVRGVPLDLDIEAPI